MIKMPKKLRTPTLAERLAEENKPQKREYPKCMFFEKKPCFDRALLDDIEDFNEQTQVCIICQLREINRHLYNMSK